MKKQRVIEILSNIEDSIGIIRFSKLKDADEGLAELLDTISDYTQEVEDEEDEKEKEE